MGRRWKRLLVTLAVAAVFAAVGLILGVIAIARFLDPFDDQPFNAAMWAAAVAQDRAPMARDAIRQVPAGTHKDRVRELFGESQPVWRDPRGPMDQYGNRLVHPETWEYYLGSWSGLPPYGFDDAFLYVHFGPDGRVVEAEVTGG